MTRLTKASMLPVLVLVLPVLALTSSLAHAESEAYGGVGIGYSTFKIDTIDFEGAALATRQFVGFRYGKYVALETGFINFGTVNDQIAVQFGQPSLNEGVKTSGYDLTLMGRYPVNKELAAFARVGMLRWDSRAELEGSPFVAKQDGDDLIWGIGLDFRGTQRVHLRVEAEFVDIEFANSWWVLTTSIMYGFPLGQ
ncbi:MAG: outer membrane beta-barrel protein [Gammaproteobacteria bacterium]